MKVGAVAINWLLIVHQTLHQLPEPTGTNWFVTSNNFMDWDKFIPFCNVGTFRKSLQWLETTSGTLHKPLGLRQPMPNRARWAGQMVISKKFDGFSKHPHLAKISSTSVWTPENFKNFLCFLSPYYSEWAVWWKSRNYCVRPRHKFHRQYWRTNTTFVICTSPVITLVFSEVSALFI